MSWLGRSLGEFGSQIGQGHDIALDWRQREQAMKLAAARAKLEELLGPLQLEELRMRLKEMGEAKPEGVISTPGGGSAGLTFQGGKYGVQQLEPGMDKNAAKAQIAKMVEAAPKEYKPALQSYADSIDAGEDPQKALEKANALMGTSATHQTVTGRLVKGDPVPDKSSITGYSRPMYDGLGNFVKMIPNIVIPGLIPKETEGWQIATDADGNVYMVPKTTVTKPVPPGTRATAGSVPGAGDVPPGAHALGHKGETGIEKDAVKASATARDAYSVLQTAEQGAKSQNPRAHLALVYAAVRSMVQGAGRMTQAEIMQEAKAGSYGQQIQRWATMAATGLLPQDQVQQILEVVRDNYEGKRQAAEQAWKYAYPDKALPPWIRKEEKKEDAVPPPPAGYIIEKGH